MFIDQGSTSLVSSSAADEKALSSLLRQFQNCFRADAVVLCSKLGSTRIDEPRRHDCFTFFALEDIASQAFHKADGKENFSSGVVREHEVCFLFLTFAVLLKSGKKGQLILLRKNIPLENTVNHNVITQSSILAQYITSAFLLINRASIKKERREFFDAGPRIMIVDDIETNRIVAEVLLCELGFSSDHARNGKEAVELCKRFKYDLILMDYHMPIMNGPDAVKEILKIVDYPIQIFACTSEQTHEVNQSCVEAGMNGIVIKPLTPTKLRKILFPIFD